MLKKPPFVYIAGAGPGNPDLITLKALKAIEESDVIIYDNLIDDSVLSNAKESSVKIYAGKSAGSHYMKQDEINGLIIEHAKKGLTVLRLKGGDPFVFGRGGEEAEALKKAGIPFEIIPGVTSAVSAPECAGIPVTHRSVSRYFTVITGQTAEGSITMDSGFAQLSKIDGTLVFLMGLSNITQICSALIKNGKSPITPAAVISNGSLKNQHVLRGNLETIGEMVKNDPNIKSPAVFVVGDVSSLNMLSETKMPLTGIKVSICGTKGFCRKLSDKLTSVGAETDILDYVDIKPINIEHMDRAIKNIKNYSVIVFTSPNSIRLFFERLKASDIDIRAIAAARFAVIGSGTGRFLKNYGIRADIMPKNFTSDYLAQELIRETSEKDKILVPRALKGNNILGKRLSEAKRQFDEIPIYDTLCSKNPSADSDTDFITFASSFGVKGFFENGGIMPEKAVAVCIGKYTADTLKEYGIKKYVVSDVADADGIKNTILREALKK